MLEKLPALRSDIQLIPAIVQGRQVLAIQDRLGLSRQTGALSAELVPLLPFFDGEHSSRDLQVAMMRLQGNRLIMLQEVEQLVQQLDERFLLQTERYRHQKNILRREFAAMESRPASLAGSAYPADEEALRLMIGGMLASTSGFDPGPTAVKAVIAPHIDLTAGKEVYAKAYATLREAVPRRVVVLGTGHAIEDGYFSLTAKNYETPLGRVPTDRESVFKLQEAGGEAIESDDFAHRSEHSIEFQILLLQHCLSHSFMVIPILVGSFADQLHGVTRPRDIPAIRGFLDLLSDLVDGNTLLVAGVDLSHVGPKFGHPQPASSYEAEFRDHDGRLLEALCRGSVEEFWAEGRMVGDRFHVCGFSALACLLEVLPDCRGTLLGYDVWHEAPTRSAVSFAAAALGEKQRTDS